MYSECNRLGFWPAMGISFQAGKSTTNAILSATNEWFILLENGAEVQAVFFNFRRHSVVSLIVYWLRNSTIWKSPVIWSDGFPVTYTTEYMQDVGVMLELSSPPQVYCKVLFCMGPLLNSWFILIVCLGFSYLVAPLFSLLTTSCFIEWSLGLKVLAEFRATLTNYLM